MWNARRHCESFSGWVVASSTLSMLKDLGTNYMLPLASLGWRASCQRSWTRPIARGRRKRGSRSKIRRLQQQRGQLMGRSDTYGRGYLTSNKLADCGSVGTDDLYSAK